MIDANEKLSEMKAEIFRALGHPIRLAIFEALRDGPVCVCELAAIAGAERSNVSRHLSMMVSAGVLTSSKNGLNVYYSLRTPCLLNSLNCVEKAVRQQLREQSDLLQRMNGDVQ